jgi:glycosyltransferase involved in cell wall biosynthesis
MNIPPQSSQKVLIIATNFTVSNLAERVSNGNFQRVDYFELADRTGGEYIDYEKSKTNHFLNKIEAAARLDFRLAIRAARLVKKKGFTTVVSLSERVGIPLSLLLPRSVKHIVIQHHPLSKNKIRLEKAFGVFRHWDRVITISRAEKEALLQLIHTEPAKITALPCAVDTDFFSPKSKPNYTFALGIVPEPPVKQEDHIESLGLSHRDYLTLIEAMKLLPDIPCYFRVASPWSTHQSNFSVDQLPGNIIQKPYVEPDELVDEISTSRFIVVPVKKVTQWSAGCTTIQIAQSLGKAVIASDLPGLRDYVIHNETGILVEPENPNALADAIAFLWKNPDLARNMGIKGREFQIKNLALDLWLNKILQLIDGNHP